MRNLKLKILSLLVVSFSISFFIHSCSNKKDVNFADHIAPLVHKHCTPCHRINGGAPFQLFYFHEIKKKAKMIAHVTQSGYMPPWPADPNYSHFIGERILSENEKQLFKNWYQNGCKMGDTSKINYPKLNEMVTQLGKPDLILPIKKINIVNNNKDKFYIIKIPYSIARDTFVSAVEFVPGLPQLVHHMNGHLFNFDSNTNPFQSETLVDKESSDFYSQFNELKLNNSDGSLPYRIHSVVNYLPGTFGIKYPEGLGGFTMSKNGAYMAYDIHYGPSTKNLIDSSKLYIYYAKKRPQRPTSELMLGTNGVAAIEPPLVIPPNKITKHQTQVTIYNDISILTINPHLHLLGKSFKAFAIKPNGDTINLIHIPKWQFRWQYFYTFTKPVKVPKGSTIMAIAEFDNTNKNPNNPNNPPIQVSERLEFNGASMRTTDEMFQFIITYFPYQKGDENINLHP